MRALKGKKIILCITGSIAAYKAAFLIRLLVKAGSEVKVIMTEASKAFISPLSLSTLSKNEVLSSISNQNQWNNHVELGYWADLLIIAPCTANSMAKMANGITDNLMLATYLSAKCPIMIAPAMDLDMWQHPATKENLVKLRSFGNQIIPVSFGELASGLTGDGRMAEPQEICEYIDQFFKNNQELADKKILITAGPTNESIDPVRFIGNPSTGKMGIALAEECAKRGAEVHLILGPTHLRPIHSNIALTSVKTAQEMYEACQKIYPQTTAAILTAAVADYTPVIKSDQKIKKKDDVLILKLKRTVDIAYELGKQKRTDQINIGFALETQNELVNSKKKLKKKNFDFIVLNSLNTDGAGFMHDTNKISIVHKNDRILNYPLKSKTKVAIDIVNELTEIFKS